MIFLNLKSERSDVLKYQHFDVAMVLPLIPSSVVYKLTTCSMMIKYLIFIILDMIYGRINKRTKFQEKKILQQKIFFFLQQRFLIFSKCSL